MKSANWNPETNEMDLTDLTQEEEADILARQLANSPARTQADELQRQIDVIEKDTILNRGSRELELLTMEAVIAPQIAQLNHVTVQQVLDASIYYKKLKALDTQVSNLRSEMAVLWTLINP